MFLGLALYQLAGASARQGHREDALDRLRQALEHGPALAGVSNDPDLAALHCDPEFEAIIAAAEQQRTK